MHPSAIFFITTGAPAIQICSQFSDLTDQLIFFLVYDEYEILIWLTMGIALSGSSLLPATAASQPLSISRCLKMWQIISCATSQYRWTGPSLSQHLVLHAASVQENTGM